MTDHRPFDSLHLPAPDPAAKRRAIAAARQRFAAQHSAAVVNETVGGFEKECQSPQGWWRRLRLMVGNVAGQWSSTMTEGKRIMTAVASACLLVVALQVTDWPSLESIRPDADSSSSMTEEGAESGMGDAVQTSTLSAETVASDAQQRRLSPWPENVELPETAADAGDAFAVSAINAAPPGRPDETRSLEESERARSAAHAVTEDATAAAGHDAGSGNRLDAEVQVSRAGLYSSNRQGVEILAGAPSARVVAPRTVLGEPGLRQAPRHLNRDRFPEVDSAAVQRVAETPVSTFSADVDTASYSFVRRLLNRGQLPQPDAVRVEEMLNYFDYAYPGAENREQPFAATVMISESPWAPGRQLLQIGIRGFDLPAAERPRSNLVFLVDVSGSMRSADKLPLVKQSLQLLLSTLEPEDSVAIAVYAGAAGVVLPPTPVREKQKIVDALRQLEAGGSTSGAEGIRLAYQLAESNFAEDAVNRVILATDGDFNVGIADPRSLKAYVARQREGGVFLSVLGFGRGNYNDALMQALAQNGNGIAAYIDTLGEAQKLLVHEATSTLFPIASDVKLQVEFNPARVAEYRLIGYETRALAREDFANDRVDAGDIGAGHTVTALYEIALTGSQGRQIPESRYGSTAARSQATSAQPTSRSEELAFLRMRYKLPGAQTSTLITRPITDADTVVSGSLLEREARFAAAVAGAAQRLKSGRTQVHMGWDALIALAQSARGEDPFGYRTEFVQLLRKAQLAESL